MEVSVIICRVEYNPSAKGISLMAFSRVHSWHTFLNTPPMCFSLVVRRNIYQSIYCIYIYHTIISYYIYNSQLTANTFLSNQSHNDERRLGVGNPRLICGISVMGSTWVAPVLGRCWPSEFHHRNQRNDLFDYRVPSGNLTFNIAIENGPSIVDLPIENGDFP